MNFKNKLLIEKIGISALIIVLLVLIYSATTTLAVMNFNISMSTDQKRIMAGQEVVVSIDLTDTIIEEFPITAFLATIEYDKSVFEELTNDSFKLNSGEESGAAYNPENDRFVMDCNLSNDANLVNITFKVKENFNVDFLYNTEIKLTDIVASDGVSEITPDDIELEVAIVREIDELLKIELVQNGNKRLIPGEETVISLNVKNLANEGVSINSFLAGFVYDKNVFEELTEDSFMDKDGMKMQVVFNPNLNKFVMHCNLVEDDVLVNVKFKVKEDAVIGDITDATIVLNSIIAADGVNDYYIEDAKIEVKIVKSNELVFDEYTIIEDRFISGIRANTTVLELKAKMNATDILKVYSGLDEVGDNELLSTGMIIKINDETEYVVVVMADLNGDGKATALDLSRMKLHVVNVQNLMDESLMAADINGDKDITALDLSKLKRIIVCLDK